MAMVVKEQRQAEAMERLRRNPWITVDDWAVIHGVNRNTAFKEVAAGKVPGSYRVGHQIRIPSALERQRLGLTENAQQAA